VVSLLYFNEFCHPIRSIKGKIRNLRKKMKIPYKIKAYKIFRVKLLCKPNMGKEKNNIDFLLTQDYPSAKLKLL